MREITALQAALAAQHATVYGYGVVGAVLRGDDRDYAGAALQSHLLVRDRLIALISTQQATPVAAQPAYRLPLPVTDHAAARQLAAHLEEGDAGSLWDLVAATPPGSHVRSLAIGWLSDTAVRAGHWGARQALPGQPA
jgi:hypothetical protein